MAWVKIPAEHHPLFLDVVPSAPDIETVRMFGAIALMVNGNMSCGLFARSMMARLSPADQARVLAMDGGAPFDPMGNGRTMKDTVMLPESVMSSPKELRHWIDRSIAFTRTLPPKNKKKEAKVKATPPKPTKPAKPASVAKLAKVAKVAKAAAKAATAKKTASSTRRAKKPVNRR